MRNISNIWIFQFMVILVLPINGIVSQCTENDPIAEFIEYPPLISITCEDDLSAFLPLPPLFYTNNGPVNCLIEGFAYPIEEYAPNTAYSPILKRYVYRFTDDRGNTIEQEAYILLEDLDEYPVNYENPPPDITVDCRNIPFPDLWVSNGAPGNCEISGMAEKSQIEDFNCEEGGVVTQNWKFFNRMVGNYRYSRNVTILPDREKVIVENADVEIKGNLMSSPISAENLEFNSSPGSSIIYLSGTIPLPNLGHGIHGQKIVLFGLPDSNVELTNTQNILLSQDNSTLFINENDIIKFIYSETKQKWLQVSYSNN